MTILLLGKNGQVGYELQRALSPLGNLIALDRSTNTQGLCGDVSDFAAIRHAFDVVQPDVIVNASAYTAVDKAESEQENANLINHLAVAHLANCAKNANALLIHYSTDYVFDGTGSTAWVETDSTNPINIYGATKRDGELALAESGADFMNFRTSWVYGVHGNNFIKTMLNLAKTKDTLSIINDQIGAPTSAHLIADTTAHAIAHYLNHDDKKALVGHYHLAPQGETSWYDYAKLIFKTARSLGADLAIQTVNPIATSDYPTPAKRPHNSRLNTQKLERTFGIALPNWQDEVVRTVALLVQKAV
ncbi:dTDP-4-dehydrorhamnose reductase [Moraxella caviae]|uniref:dTDP-4-dehydrorhamnose reductase n=1 Tax=Moraxella caviae TaxID=34060 RepID=A0A1T0A3F5_9GAMM|nr:dTDP-4-dehydrorhamnose reductase [Moraxella caviae]OOR90247.1 dTDP-4-dehydrorhamnose reductase [Moraxella caviae]